MDRRGNRPPSGGSPRAERQRRYAAAAAAGRFGEALEAARELVAIDPTDAENHAAEGRALLGLSRWAEAEAALERSTAIDPGPAGPWLNLGLARERCERFDEAIAAYHAATDRDPLDPQAAIALSAALAAVAAGEEAGEAIRRFARTGPPDLEVMRFTAYLANLLPDRTPTALAALHRTYGIALRGAVEPIAADRRLGGPFRPPRREPGEPIRIGFFGGDFREHPVGRFLLPVFEAFDRSEIRPFAYMLSPQRDGRSARFAAMLGPDWVEAHALDAVGLVARARRDRLDVAVDLQGLTAGARLGEFACRMATVQATWLGYSNTTGVPGIDLRIVDAMTDPEGSESHASERLVRVAAPFIRWVADAPVVPRTTGRSFTFGCLSATERLNPAVARLFAGATLAVPGSRLLVKSPGLASAGARARWLGWLGEAGLAADRVELRGRTATVDEHVALHGAMDVALDTFPGNGTTTTVEALAQGVPVVTLAGDRHASRVGASLLAAVGLPELVASSAEGFVEAARRIAGDAERLATLRRELPGRIAAGPLGDARGLAGELTRVFREALATGMDE